MTKAVGSTAAMILMDRGKLNPDTPVAEILPEFAKKQVLEGFDAEGKPLMRPPRTQATVRHLATHTSGLTYEFWNAELAQNPSTAFCATILPAIALTEAQQIANAVESNALQPAS